MKVGLISYPMLWQRQGGVQNKIHNTLVALSGLGVESRLFDINTDCLTDFDLLHVFCMARVTIVLLRPPVMLVFR